MMWLSRMVQRVSTVVVIACAVILTNPDTAQAGEGGRHWCNACEMDAAAVLVEEICANPNPPDYYCGQVNSCWYDEAFEEYVIGYQCYNNGLEQCPVLFPSPGC